MIAELRGMSFKRADRATLERAIQRSIEPWLYEIAWMPLDQPKAPNDSDPSERPRSATTRRWLILADRGGLGRQLAEHLTARAITACLPSPTTVR